MRLRSCVLAVLLGWAGACVIDDDGPGGSQAHSRVCQPAETCVCDGAGACEADCDAGDCSLVCRGSGSCDLTCAGGGCDAVCEGSGRCTFECPGGGCSLACEGPGECRLAACDDCELTCNGTGVCRMD